MKYLIDTHAFLWFNAGSTELSQSVRALIEDRNNEIFVSIASLWEISIKTSLNKLSISGTYEQILNDVIENSMEILPINFAHTVIQNKLSFHHKDPFDRIIVAQAIVESMVLVSKDIIFDEYLSKEKVKRLW